MNRQQKIELLSEEIKTIKNMNIRQFAEDGVALLPDYFFSISASSTNKYHPSYSLGEGGLYRHVKGLVRIALELFRLSWWGFTKDEEDLMLVAILLHDGWKQGDGSLKFTVTEHPLLAAQAIEKAQEDGVFPTVTAEQVKFVCSCISTHMGQWRQDYKSGETVLPAMENKYQKFVHLCDYIGSRKCLEVNFEVPMVR